MKIFINRPVSFAALVFVIFALLISCKDNSTEPKNNLVIDPALVGTWKLTKIITSIGGQDVELTPEAAGIASTVTFKSDGTFESTNTDSKGTTQDNGTWGTYNGNLTIHITGEEPETTPYEFIDDMNVSIEQTIELGEGNEVLATLIFTKQP